jgi:hypothetical protein
LVMFAFVCSRTTARIVLVENSLCTIAKERVGRPAAGRKVAVDAHIPLPSSCSHKCRRSPTR